MRGLGRAVVRRAARFERPRAKSAGTGGPGRRSARGSRCGFASTRRCVYRGGQEEGGGASGSFTTSLFLFRCVGRIGGGAGLPCSALARGVGLSARRCGGERLRPMRFRPGRAGASVVTIRLSPRGTCPLIIRLPVAGGGWGGVETFASLELGDRPHPKCWRAAALRLSGAVPRCTLYRGRRHLPRAEWAGVGRRVPRRRGRVLVCSRQPPDLGVRGGREAGGDGQMHAQSRR